MRENGWLQLIRCGVAPLEPLEAESTLSPRSTNTHKRVFALRL